MKLFVRKRTVPPVYLLLCSILFSCNRGTPEQITTTVTLLHIPPAVHTAYLEEIRPAATYTIDTAVIDPLKGSFAFTCYPTGSEGLYRVRLDDSTQLLLALDNTDVTVRGDYLHADSLQIEGSPASAALQGFLSHLNAKNRELRHTLQEYAYLQKIHGRDSLLKLSRTKIYNQREALLNTILEEARSTKSPVNAVFALSILDDSGAWEKGKPLFNRLEQRFPRNELVKQAVEAYHRRINDEGRTMSITTGDDAPDISYPDTAGKVISLSTLRGKYVLVDFWASWCAPCRAANPALVKAWKQFRNKNFTILGVSLDTKKTSWEEAIIHDKLGWLHVSDLKGWNSAPAAAYGVEAIPANFLVDPAGKVIATGLEGDSLVQKLKAVLTP